MKITLLVTDFEDIDLEEEIDIDEGDTIRVYYNREKDDMDWEVL